MPAINVEGISKLIDDFVAFFKEFADTLKKFIAGFKSNYDNLTTAAAEVEGE